MKALSKALREEGLKDLVPDEYFSEAIKTINVGNSIIQLHMKHLKNC